MKKIALLSYSTSLLFLVMAILPSCGGVLDPCIDTNCPGGEVCVVINEEAVCQASGGDGDSGNTEGETCETDADCAVGLVCEAGIDAVLECMPGT